MLLRQRHLARSFGPRRAASGSPLHPARYGVQQRVVRWPYGRNVWLALVIQAAEDAAVTWEDWGEIIRLHDPDDYSGTPVHFFEAMLKTSGAVARARLYNVTAGAPIAASEVSTNSATAVRRRSGPFSLPSGDNEYKAQIGEA